MNKVASVTRILYKTAQNVSFQNCSKLLRLDGGERTLEQSYPEKSRKERFLVFPETENTFLVEGNPHCFRTLFSKTAQKCHFLSGKAGKRSFLLFCVSSWLTLV